mmetsp:Transcript_28452/g.36935  ORF Transcript_28452/g.36935 Transcript_28452/m.36935 type:complete len:403 (-) Transcript_28452:120-1328(-)
MDIVGKNCTGHKQCVSFAFACIEGSCGCVPGHGYVGEECLEPSGITYFYRFILILVLLFSLLFFYFSTRIFYIYSIKPILEVLRFSKSVRIQPAPLPASRPSNQNFPKNMRKKLEGCNNVKIVSKDRTLIWNLLLQVGFILLVSGNILSLTTDPWMVYESASYYIFAPLTFFCLTMAQLEIGLGWLEVFVKHDRLHSIARNFVKVRKGVHCLAVTEASIMGYLIVTRQSPGFEYMFVMVFCLICPLICIPSGLVLSIKLLKLHQECLQFQKSYDNLLLKESTRMRFAIKRLFLSFSCLVISSLLANLFLYSNGWLYAWMTGSMCFSLYFYQAGILAYIDRNGFIFGGYSDINSLAHDPEEPAAEHHSSTGWSIKDVYRIAVSISTEVSNHPRDHMHDSEFKC